MLKDKSGLKEARQKVKAKNFRCGWSAHINVLSTESSEDTRGMFRQIEMDFEKKGKRKKADGRDNFCCCGRSLSRNNQIKNRTHLLRSQGADGAKKGPNAGGEKRPLHRGIEARRGRRR